MQRRVYLDWNATTSLRPEAREAMLAAMALSGNPSSVHAEGRAARAMIEAARISVAAAVGGKPASVVFTSGGTEANALALTPGWSQVDRVFARLIVSAIEHPSVLAGGRFPSEHVTIAPVTSDGVVDLEKLRQLLADGSPALVSLMAANNETGAIQPVAEAASIVHAAGGILHVDAVQALGRLLLDVVEIGADLVTLSAHKMGGPKGAGALIVANSELRASRPLIAGGGQERGRRAGTENVVGIAGFGAAAEAVRSSLATETATMLRLRQQLEAGLREMTGVEIFSSRVPRLPNTTLFGLRGVRAETAVIGFDLEGIAVSSGAACSSGKVQPSHVLAAMGVAPELARSAIRVSLGPTTEETDIPRCLEAWRKLTGVLGRVG